MKKRWKILIGLVLLGAIVNMASTFSAINETEAETEVVQLSEAETQKAVLDLEKQLLTMAGEMVEAFKHIDYNGDRVTIYQNAEYIKEVADHNRSILYSYEIPEGLKDDVQEKLEKSKSKFESYLMASSQQMKLAMEYADTQKPSILSDVKIQKEIALNSSRDSAQYLIEAKQLVNLPLK